MENQQENIPMEETTNIDSIKKPTGSVGPMIGSLIVIIIITIGGFYFWNSISERLNKESVIDAQVEELGTQSDSDEIEDIEADLQNTNFDDLDTELDAIDQEFENI